MTSNNLGFSQADVVHGKPELDIAYDPETFQYYSDTCAIQSQALVLQEYGINVSQEELKEIAIVNGWYAEGYGTPEDKVGKLLEHYGIPCSASEGNNIFNISNELAQGHNIIVSVDSGELWDPESEGGFFQSEDNHADHALVVVGLDTSDPDDVKVIVTDPGNGNKQMAYSESQFIDAWKDSNCYMTTTEVAPEELSGELCYEPMSQFAGIPLSELQLLAEADLNPESTDFSTLVSQLSASPEDATSLVASYCSEHSTDIVEEPSFEHKYEQTMDTEQFSTEPEFGSADLFDSDCQPTEEY